MKPKVSVIGLCIMLVLFVTGCRNSNQLHGTVRIYTSMYEDVISKVETALNKRFPDVTIEFVQGETGILQKKIENELDSGKLGCDIIMLADPSYSFELKERDILRPYISPYAQNIALPYDPDGYWYSVRVSNMVLAYNPEKKQRHEVAITFKDFAEQAQLQGKIAMPNPLKSGTALAAISALYDAYGDPFFQKLKEQHIALESTASALTKLESGEYDEIMVLEEVILKKRQETQTPVAVIYPGDGSIVISSTIMMINNTYAANHNTSACNAVVDWFLSEGGQKTIVEGWMHSVLKNIQLYPYGSCGSAQIFKNALPVDWLNVFQNREQLRNMFASYIINKD